MKLWVIGIVICLVVVSLVIVTATIAKPYTAESENSGVYSGPSSGFCDGSCSEGSYCGNPNCGAKVTGTCGCRG